MDLEMGLCWALNKSEARPVQRKLIQRWVWCHAAHPPSAVLAAISIVHLAAAPPAQATDAHQPSARQRKGSKTSGEQGCGRHV
eukprot:1165525-Rhodomonas_salina.2